MTDFLKTNRLTISFTERSHFEDILQLRSDPDVQRFTIQRPQSHVGILNDLWIL
ncbi:hypothetical protein Lmor_0511 [Legionella moravica]|uniref:Uncharacterized protein n=1 Tax=Legionella moravica TaxID=39962 RepID=A0A378JUM2_9GAMM|nr:hypothetical protein [Legionella moravica]KTD37648.1 hypothetical protein Lmor_0511 [Legionella moravica]STX61707.1 Uncharacterised protein [Legionella moravica]HEN5528811.1 hypothetical protein [Legionella pneumophila]